VQPNVMPMNQPPPNLGNQFVPYNPQIPTMPGPNMMQNPNMPGPIMPQNPVMVQNPNIVQSPMMQNPNIPPNQNFLPIQLQNPNIMMQNPNMMQNSNIQNIQSPVMMQNSNVQSPMMQNSNMMQNPNVPSPMSPVMMQNQNPNLMQQPMSMPGLNPSASVFRMNAKKRTRNPLEISIPEAHTVHHPHKFTSYTIEIDIQGIIPFRNVKWQTQHSYQEFRDFYKRMKPAIASKGITSSIQFPPKTLINHYDDHHVEQRRLGLQNFIRVMYTYFNPEETSEFDSFILYDVYLNQAISQAEVVDMEQQYMRSQEQSQGQSFGLPTAPPPDYS